MIESGRKSILIVDDEKINIVALTNILSSDYSIFAAKSGNEALEILKEHRIDVILLDIVMPDMDGYQLITILKENDDTRQIPVIFVTGLKNSENEEKGFEMGAADYISKPFVSSIVKLRVKNQIHILNQFEIINQLSTTDQLTGISNRRNFDTRLELEWERAKRDKVPLTLFMIDIDNFKIYNDTYGHLQGDTALQITAKVILQTLKRSIDFAARWGGEEFAVLLPDTDLPGTLIVAKNIRKNVENASIPCLDGGITKITVSIGVNIFTPQQGSSLKDFINGADKALYIAKKTGKNKVSLYEDIQKK